MTKSKKSRKSPKSRAPKARRKASLPRQKPSPKRTIAVRLTVDLDRALRSLARERKQTVTSLVVFALRSLVDAQTLRDGAEVQLPSGVLFGDEPPANENGPPGRHVLRLDDPATTTEMLMNAPPGTILDVGRGPFAREAADDDEAA